MSHPRLFFCCLVLLTASLLIRAGECGGWCGAGSARTTPTTTLTSAKLVL